MQRKPCLYRQVNDDGEVLCRKIKTGDRAVTPSDCQACPIAEIDCSHLRATLLHAGHPPLLVRYGNGKTEVWDDPTPPLAFERAACATQIQALHSLRECVGCAQRQALSLAIDHRRPQSVTSGPAATAVAVSVRARRRVRAAAGRIIPLELLPQGKERRVGWTD